MKFKSRFCLTAVLIYSCFLAASAQAGQLFPPANIGPNPNVACPNGQVLAWTGETVACTNPTPGVSVSCLAGQVLMGITNGVPVCTTVPSCQAGQLLNYNGTSFVCTASTIPTCAAGQAITYNGSSFVCVNEDPSVPTCAAGQFLTYNGVAFQCSDTQSVSIPTCGANQFVTSNGTQFSCANLPGSGGGGGTGTWCGYFWNFINNRSGVQSWGGTPCGSTPVISGSCNIPGEMGSSCNNSVPNASECPVGYTFSGAGSGYTCIKN